MIIPIAMATDNNYIIPTCVAMESVMSNTEKNDIHFIILHEEGLKESNIVDLKSIMTRYNNCNVKFICVSEHFNDVKITLKEVPSQATFYRLGISKYLQEYKKCIYLDSDVIVERELEALIQEDIKNYYLAGVIAYEIADRDSKYLKELLRYDKTNEYINAGVLLLNLEMIRKNNLQEKFFFEMKYPYPMQDQDIINKVCAGQIKILEYKYNAMMKYYHWDINQYKELATQDEIYEAKNNPVIIHYADVLKPWKNPYCACAKNWWKYFWKIDNAQEKFELLRLEMEQEHEKLCSKHAQEIVNLNNSYWKLLNRTLSFYDKLYIYGAGVYGKKLCSILSKKGIQIEGFIVSDNESLNENTQNISGFVERKESNYLILVAVSDRYLNVILDSLEKHNIDNYITLGSNEINSLDIDC